MLTKIPIATCSFAYQREWLRADVVAGLTVAAVVIPQAMAYAVIAGLPVEAGLYTALAAMLVLPFAGKLAAAERHHHVCHRDVDGGRGGRALLANHRH